MMKDIIDTLRDPQGRRNCMAALAACAFGYWLAVLLVAVVFSKEVAAAQDAYFTCPRDTVRVTRTVGANASGAGYAVQVEISCEPIPQPEYIHPTFSQEAPPIEIPQEDE